MVLLGRTRSRGSCLGQRQDARELGEARIAQGGEDLANGEAGSVELFIVAVEVRFEFDEGGFELFDLTPAEQSLVHSVLLPEGLAAELASRGTDQILEEHGQREAGFALRSVQAVDDARWQPSNVGEMMATPTTAEVVLMEYLVGGTDQALVVRKTGIIRENEFPEKSSSLIPIGQVELGLAAIGARDGDLRHGFLLLV